ncbi:MAG: PorT family protein, partial [Proteiniphilum sp.]|nr:PorT family protein [Proteiniphilum sp.]
MKIAFTLILLSSLLSASNNSYGQQRSLQHRPYADQQLFHLGFTVGFHTQDLILTQTGYRNVNGEV